MSRLWSAEVVHMLKGEQLVQAHQALAKEGFDWVWCEHALTIGYRPSLTEIVQIIGRATRDAPGKLGAVFTNLVAEPGVETGWS